MVNDNDFHENLFCTNNNTNAIIVFNPILLPELLWLISVNIKMLSNERLNEWQDKSCNKYMIFQVYRQNTLRPCTVEAR